MTHHTATKATPYSLVYGVKAVIPIEVQVTSLRVAVHQGITKDENDKLRLRELDMLDERRLAAQQRLQSYQTQISAPFDKMVVGAQICTHYKTTSHGLVAMIWISFEVRKALKMPAQP